MVGPSTDILPHWLSLPAEIWCEILAQTEPNIIRNVLPKVCKSLSTLVGTHYRHIFPSDAGYYLYPEQITARARLHKAKEDVICLISPMSSGKTATALMWAIKRPTNEKIIIVVSPRVITTWLDEFVKFGLILTKDPSESHVLFHYTTHPEHKKATVPGFTQRFVLTTQYYIQSNRSKLFESKAFEKESVSFIFDEAHLLKGHYMYQIHRLVDPLYNSFGGVAEIKKILMISATPFYAPQPTLATPNFNFKNIKRIVIEDVPIADTADDKRYPKIVPTISWWQGDEDILFGILLNICQRRNRVVVFFDFRKEKVNKLSKALVKHIHTHQIFLFMNNSSSRQSQIRKAKKSIIFCNYRTGSEGVNFDFCDGAVFFQFENISPEKARQTVGRVRRRNNRHQEVEAIFVFDTHPTEYVRMKLNQMYACDLKIPRVVKKKIDCMEKIIGELTKEGVDVYQLKDHELMILFGFFDKRISFKGLEFSPKLSPLTLLELSMLA